MPKHTEDNSKEHHKKHKKHKRSKDSSEEGEIAHKKARKYNSDSDNSQESRSASHKQVKDSSKKEKSSKHTKHINIKKEHRDKHRYDSHANVGVKKEEDFDRRQEELSRRRDERLRRHGDARNARVKQECDFNSRHSTVNDERRRNDQQRRNARDTRDSHGNVEEAFRKESTPPEKEKPNLGLSGALTEDTNTFRGVVIKYNEPPEAKIPKKKWRLYPFKGTEALKTLHLHRQSAYLLGRLRRIADIPIDHPSCSKQHAVIQFRMIEEEVSGQLHRRVKPYIIDLGAANGTYVNNERIEPQRYVELKEQDMLKFGFSSREYVLLHDKSDTRGVESSDDNEDD